MSKILKTEHNKIIQRYRNAERINDIASDFRVASVTIQRIINRYIESEALTCRIRPPLPCRHDITGEMFKELQVIEMVPPVEKRKAWKARCLCQRCGSTHLLLTHCSLKSRKNPTCGCWTFERTKGSKHSCWTGCGDVSGAFFNQIRKGARARNIEFNLTIDYIWSLYLTQGKKCKLSGIDLSFGASNYDETTASLDRIDSLKGYVEGNVQWLHKFINKMKLDHSEQIFIDLCSKVYYHSLL